MLSLSAFALRVHVQASPEHGKGYDTVEGMNKNARTDPTLYGAAAGRVVEEEKFVYVSGWASVEVSKQSVA